MRRGPGDLSIAGCCSKGCCSTPSTKPVVEEKRPPLRRGALARSSCYWRSPIGGREGRQDGPMDLGRGRRWEREGERGDTRERSVEAEEAQVMKGRDMMVGQQGQPWHDGPHRGAARTCSALPLYLRPVPSSLNPWLRLAAPSSSSFILLLAYTTPRPLGCLRERLSVLLHPRRSSLVLSMLSSTVEKAVVLLLSHCERRVPALTTGFSR